MIHGRTYLSEQIVCNSLFSYKETIIGDDLTSAELFSEQCITRHLKRLKCQYSDWQFMYETGYISYTRTQTHTHTYTQFGSESSNFPFFYMYIEIIQDAQDALRNGGWQNEEEQGLS